jgi:hypothetical protein
MRLSMREGTEMRTKFWLETHMHLGDWERREDYIKIDPIQFEYDGVDCI